jgi:hypothetical protein
VIRSVPHAYLACELAARFHGTRRRWQYLSDGGHFENTAIYELLRPERRVGLIVVCDCGCDGDYRFGDLANLIRLARIDFGLEIVVDQAAPDDAVLGPVFGTPDDFTANAPPESRDKVAILLNVHIAGQAGPDSAPITRIVLLKPRLTPSAPATCGSMAQCTRRSRRKARPTSSSMKRSGKAIARSAWPLVGASPAVPSRRGCSATCDSAGCNGGPTAVMATLPPPARSGRCDYHSPSLIRDLAWHASREACKFSP